MTEEGFYRRNFHSDRGFGKAPFELDQIVVKHKQPTDLIILEGLEAPRNSFDIPARCFEEGVLQTQLRQADIPIGFELPRSLTTPTKREQPQPKFMQFSEIPKAEQEQRRRSTNVIARLLGLDTILARDGGRNSRGKFEKRTSDQAGVQEHNQEHRQHLWRETDRSHHAANKQNGRLPAMHVLTDLSVQTGRWDLESSGTLDVEVLPFRKHPQEQQLQEFKREFAARFASQGTGRPSEDEDLIAPIQGVGEQENLQVHEAQLDCARDAIEPSRELFDALRFLQANKELFLQVLRHRKSVIRLQANVDNSKQARRVVDQKQLRGKVNARLNGSASRVKPSAQKSQVGQQTSENFCCDQDAGSTRFSGAVRGHPSVHQTLVPVKSMSRQSGCQIRTSAARNRQEGKGKGADSKTERKVVLKLNSPPRNLSTRKNSTEGAMIQSRGHIAGGVKQSDVGNELVKEAEKGRTLMQELAERRRGRLRAVASVGGDGESASSRAAAVASCSHENFADTVEGAQQETIVRCDPTVSASDANETRHGLNFYDGGKSLEREENGAASKRKLPTAAHSAAQSRVAKIEEKLPSPFEQAKAKAPEDGDQFATSVSDAMDSSSEISCADKGDQPSPVSVLETTLFHERLSPPRTILASSGANDHLLLKDFKQRADYLSILPCNAAAGQNASHPAKPLRSSLSVPTVTPCSPHRRSHIVYVRDLLIAAGFTKHGMACLRSFSGTHGLDPHLFRRLEHRYSHKRLFPPDPRSCFLTEYSREAAITPLDRRLLYDAVDRIVLDLSMPTVAERYSWPRPAKPRLFYMHSGKQLLQLIWTSIASDSALNCNLKDEAIDDLLVRDLKQSTWVISVSEFIWLGAEIEAQIFDSLVVEAVHDFAKL